MLKQSDEDLMLRGKKLAGEASGAGVLENQLAMVAAHPEAKGWPMPILEYNQDGIAGADDLRRFVEGLKSLRRQIEAHSYEEIHFFFAGPVQACAIAGAAFINWLPVRLYQKTQSPAERLYEYWMPLKKI